MFVIHSQSDLCSLNHRRKSLFGDSESLFFEFKFLNFDHSGFKGCWECFLILLSSMTGFPFGLKKIETESSIVLVFCEMLHFPFDFVLNGILIY